MPRRNDLHRILIVGSGPIIIGQACEFDYSGTQACKALRADGYEVVLINSNPATIMTDPDLADRTYVEPLTRAVSAKRSSAASGPTRCSPPWAGRPGLNLSVELAEAGVLDKYGVELIGAKIDAIKKAEDRLLFKDAMRKIGLETPQSQLVNTSTDGLEFAGAHRLSRDPAAQLHAGRHGRRHRLQPRRAGRDSGARPGPFAGARSADRRERARLEGIRAGGDARSGRQRHHRLLHREFRSDGRAHRRFHHGGAGADAHRPRISDDARRRARAACARSAWIPAARTCSSPSIRRTGAW